MTRQRIQLVLCGLFALNDSICMSAEISLNRPTAIAAGDDVSFVASAGGSVFALNVAKLKLNNEFKIGGSLVDLVRVPNSSLFLALDAKQRQLILCEHSKNQLVVLQALPVTGIPNRMAVSSNNSICITFLWSEAVELFQCTPGNETTRAKLEPVATVDVGFPSQEVIAITASRFLVADRFGGQLALVANQKSIEYTIHGHNVRGLAIDHTNTQVLISHQVLSKAAQSSFDDIHWGMLIQNVVRRIPIKEFLNEKPAKLKGQIVRLGDTGSGFADPSGIVSIMNGFAVVSAGTDQIAIHNDQSESQLHPTQRRPTRLKQIDGKFLVIVNSLANSLSVFQPSGLADNKHIFHGTILSNPAATQISTLGESFFYDASLSHDGWMSCHSCHTDGHSPDLLADTEGDGSFGNPKRIPSLFGVAKTGPWGWTGNKTTLDEQLTQTLKSTMQYEGNPADVVPDLSSYLKTLDAPRSNSNEESLNVAHGARLFQELKCSQCHQPNLFTSKETYDVQLKDELGNTRFNPPSLRAVKLRRRFFHDARAASLEEVFLDHKHQLSRDLTESEIGLLLAYLRSL